MKTRIIGIGNPLRRDDGAGPACVALLLQETLRPGVEALDGGEAGLALVGLLADCDSAILVDAAQMGALPGDVRTFGLEALEANLEDERHGVHVRTETALRLASGLGLLPRRVDLVGIEPESVDWGMGLSAVVERALPRAVQAIQFLVVQHGVAFEKEHEKWQKSAF